MSAYYVRGLGHKEIDDSPSLDSHRLEAVCVRGEVERKEAGHLQARSYTTCVEGTIAREIKFLVDQAFFGGKPEWDVLGAALIFSERAGVVLGMELEVWS